MMKYAIKLLLFVIMLVHVLSCMQSTPYEIKSPCVSKDGGLLNPCVRKPLRPVA